MDPIKEAMKEAYKGHGLSRAKKIEIREKVKKPRKTFLPIVISVLLTAAMFLFVVSIIEQKDEAMNSIASISSDVAKEDGVVAMMERKLQFQSILEDGVITEKEQMDYLRTSDWGLQLAFEKGASTTTYKVPTLTHEEGIAYATLLFYMREFMLMPQNIAEITTAFSQVKDFQRLVDVIPVLDTLILTEYSPSSNEDMPSNRLFFMSDRFSQCVILLLLVVNLFLIVRMVYKGKFGFTMVLALVFILFSFILFKPQPNYFANDEASLLVSSLKGMDSIGLSSDSAELVASATFDSSRFALVKNGRTNTLVRFQNYDNAYRFTEVNSSQHAAVMSNFYHVRHDGQAIYAFALVENHPIVKGTLVIHDKKKRTYDFVIEKGKAVIESLYLPQKDISFELKFYDEYGKIVE